MQDNRNNSLDGLRGIAALIVVIFQFISAFAPHMIPRRNYSCIWISDTPLGTLWNGHTAVAIFFALSGYVLALSTSRSKAGLLVLLPKRYLRVAVPASA